MTATELATHHVPQDPVPCFGGGGGGYNMVCEAFYEWGFSVPSHQFLRSLLQFYSLELHHLTPSGILHMVVFWTLCETYMGIEPTAIRGTISSAPGYRRARLRKWWCWALWTSLSDPGPELIPSSIF
jgi:hypothetical protein